MSSIKPKSKQDPQHKNIIKEVLVNCSKRIKYEFIIINEEKSIIPPNRGVFFLCIFMTPSGTSIRLIFSEIYFLCLFTKYNIITERVDKKNSFFNKKLFSRYSKFNILYEKYLK